MSQWPISQSPCYTSFPPPSSQRAHRKLSVDHHRGQRASPFASFFSSAFNHASPNPSRQISKRQSSSLRPLLPPHCMSHLSSSPPCPRVIRRRFSRSAPGPSPSGIPHARAPSITTTRPPAPPARRTRPSFARRPQLLATRPRRSFLQRHSCNASPIPPACEVPSSSSFLDGVGAAL